MQRAVPGLRGRGNMLCEPKIGNSESHIKQPWWAGGGGRGSYNHDGFQRKRPLGRWSVGASCPGIHGQFDDLRGAA